jgi:hypothetical protein
MKTDDCNAYSFSPSTGICQMGRKGNAIISTAPGQTIPVNFLSGISLTYFCHAFDFVRYFEFFNEGCSITRVV